MGILKRRPLLLDLFCQGSQQVSDSYITQVACVVFQEKIKPRSLKWFTCKINASLDFCQTRSCIYTADARKFRTCIWKEFRILRQKAFVPGAMYWPHLCFFLVFCVFIVFPQRPRQLFLLFSNLFYETQI